MHFETAQVLTLARIGKDTLRTWKASLRPIAGIDGRRERYSMTQVVGLRLIAAAVYGLSIPVSRFAVFAGELFEGLEDQLKPTGRPLVLVISENGMSFCNPADVPDASMLAYVKVEAILADVMATIMHEKLTPPAQLELKLDDQEISPPLRSGPR